MNKSYRQPRKLLNFGSFGYHMVSISRPTQPLGLGKILLVPESEIDPPAHVSAGPGGNLGIGNRCPRMVPTVPSIEFFHQLAADVAGIRIFAAVVKFLRVVFQIIGLNPT